MNRIFYMLIFLPIISVKAQEKKLSTASQFINKSSYVQINMDENEKAVFKSGLGESVSFYPSEITDLKQNNSMFGLQVESNFIIGSQGMNTTFSKETAWIGMEEIDDLVIWFDKYVVPNLKIEAGKNKTVKYIFNCEELMLKFEVYENTQIFSVILNNTYFHDKYFWTESKVKDIPKVVSALKYLQSKRK